MIIAGIEVYATSFSFWLHEVSVLDSVSEKDVC